MEPCMQEGRITRIEASVNVITEKVNQVAGDVSVIREKVEGVTRTVEEHDHALYGNNGGVGVVAKVMQSVEVLDDLKVALKGKGEDPGLISDIRNLMGNMADQKDERKWLMRAVVGVIIAQLIGVAFMLLR